MEDKSPLLIQCLRRFDAPRNNSNFRKFHAPLFWDRVLLPEVREELFTEAFGKETIKNFRK